MTSATVALIAVGTIVGALVFALILVAFIKRVGGSAAASAATDPAAAGAMLVAGGLLERGFTEDGRQINGNGVVALFPNELRFVLGGKEPRHVVRVPRAAVVSCSATRHLSLPGIRRAGGPMWLVVEWRRSGVTHATGFQTARAEELMGTLQGWNRTSA